MKNGLKVIAIAAAALLIVGTASAATELSVKPSLTPNGGSLPPVASQPVVKAVNTSVADGGFEFGPQGGQWAESAGTGTLTGTKIVWTSSGAGMAAFRYVVYYNDTQTSPADALIGWWDYGSSLALAVGETFSLKFNSSDTTGTVLTIA